MSKKRLGGFILASALVFSGITVAGITSCAPAEKVETISKVTISNKSALTGEFTVGGKKTLEATFEGTTKNLGELLVAKTVTITSSDATVVKVEGAELTALKAGTATITLAAGEVKDTVKITVTEAFVVNAVTITNKDVLTAEWHFLEKDREIAINVDASKPVNIKEALLEGTLTITSSDAKVLVVNGVKLHAAGEGKATITVSFGGKTDTLEITVLPKVPIVTTTIKEAYKAEIGTKVGVHGQVVQISSKGFFVADATGQIYVNTKVPAGVKVGDSIAVEGLMDEYSKVKQIGYKEFRADTLVDKVDVTVTYAAKTGADLEKLYLSKIQPVEFEATCVEVFKETKLFWKVSGFTDTTIVYTGYLQAEQLKGITAGSRFKMQGFIMGSGSHNNWTKRLNFYPTTMTELEKIPVTGITVTSSVATLAIGQKATLRYTATPDTAVVFGETIEVVAGDATCVNIDTKTKRVEGVKAGKATIAIKSNGVVSNHIELTITDKAYEPTSIVTLLNEHKAGTIVNDDEYYAYGKVTGIVKEGTKAYGVYIGDGDHALLAFTSTIPETITEGAIVKVKGDVATYKGSVQLKNPTFTVYGAEETKPTIAEPTTIKIENLTTFDGMSAGRIATVTGEVTKVNVDKYGNVETSIKLSATETIKVKNDSRYVKKTILDKAKEAKVGSIVTVTGYFTTDDNRASGITTNKKYVRVDNCRTFTIDTPAPVEPAPTTPAA